MKSNKKIIGIVLIIAIVLLGIGYATMSSTTLKISGTASATASDSNFSVIFANTDGAITVSDSKKVTATRTNDTTATIAVTGLTATGDYVTATYTVQNSSAELSAKVGAEVTTNSNGTYFKVTTDWDDTKTIAAGKTATITVKVELIKTPIEDQSTDITVTLTADPVEP